MIYLRTSDVRRSAIRYVISGESGDVDEALRLIDVSKASLHTV